MRPMTDTPSHAPRRLLAAVLALLALAILLSLDLSQRGLVWRLLWSQTGEEAPLAQARGALELAGNLLRPPLQTAPLAPIANKSDRPWGINTFLQEEVESAKIEAMLRMIRDAGFVWLRQEFPWEDLEIDGRGQFTDSRDRNGDGAPDETIDAWAKYDLIVDLAEAYGLRLLVRLSNPPAWSRADADAGHFAPPDDFGDYANYATAVARRYQGRISHYQVWNEPNIYPEWGNRAIDPAGYTELLCRAYQALKAVDPAIVVVSGALAPTISLSGRDLSDVVFLQALYDTGGGDCFDVLSAQGYGLRSGPTDRRLRSTSVNIARHVYYRDIMARNGDAHKPIWLAEAAWNAILDAELPPEDISLYGAYGSVTQEQAAQYMPQLYDRVQREWAWVGNVMYWFFTRKDPFEANQAFYYFRMAEPDYQPEKPSFSPLPVYHSVKEYIAALEPTLFRGRHQAETWQISAAGALIADETARFGSAMRFEDGIAFRAHGTMLELRWRPASAAPGAWRRSTIELSPGLAQARSIIFGSGAILVDEIAVYDRSRNRLLSWIALALALGGVTLGALLLALRERRR